MFLNESYTLINQALQSKFDNMYSSSEAVRQSDTFTYKFITTAIKNSNFTVDEKVLSKLSSHFINKDLLLKTISPFFKDDIASNLISELIKKDSIIFYDIARKTDHLKGDKVVSNLIIPKSMFFSVAIYKGKFKIFIDLSDVISYKYYPNQTIEAISFNNTEYAINMIVNVLISYCATMYEREKNGSGFIGSDLVKIMASLYRDLIYNIFDSFTLNSAYDVSGAIIDMYIYIFFFENHMCIPKDAAVKMARNLILANKYSADVMKTMLKDYVTPNEDWVPKNMCDIKNDELFKTPLHILCYFINKGLGDNKKEEVQPNHILKIWVNRYGGITSIHALDSTAYFFYYVLALVFKSNNAGSLVFHMDNKITTANKAKLKKLLLEYSIKVLSYKKTIDFLR